MLASGDFDLKETGVGQLSNGQNANKTCGSETADQGQPNTNLEGRVDPIEIVRHPLLLSLLLESLEEISTFLGRHD